MNQRVNLVTDKIQLKKFPVKHDFLMKNRFFFTVLKKKSDVSIELADGRECPFL